MNMHEGDRDPCEGPDSGFQRSCATALFELLAAAAGTWFGLAPIFETTG